VFEQFFELLAGWWPAGKLVNWQAGELASWQAGKVIVIEAEAITYRSAPPLVQIQRKSGCQGGHFWPILCHFCDRV